MGSALHSVGFIGGLRFRGQGLGFGLGFGFWVLGLGFGGGGGGGGGGLGFRVWVLGFRGIRVSGFRV